MISTQPVQCRGPFALMVGEPGRDGRVNVAVVNRDNNGAVVQSARVETWCCFIYGASMLRNVERAAREFYHVDA